MSHIKAKEKAAAKGEKEEDRGDKKQSEEKRAKEGAERERANRRDGKTKGKDWGFRAGRKRRESDGLERNQRGGG